MGTLQCVGDLLGGSLDCKYRGGIRAETCLALPARSGP